MSMFTQNVDILNYTLRDSVSSCPIMTKGNHFSSYLRGRLSFAKATRSTTITPELAVNEWHPKRIWIYPAAGSAAPGPMGNDGLEIEPEERHALLTPWIIYLSSILVHRMQSVERWSSSVSSRDTTLLIIIDLRTPLDALPEQFLRE